VSDPVTTEAVALAAGVHPSTISRWVKLGLLPQPQVIYRGRRGKQTRWVAHAPAQAKWVQARLDAGLTFDEVAAALGRGEFAIDDTE
jgi:hypothetical protein